MADKESLNVENGKYAIEASEDSLIYKDTDSVIDLGERRAIRLDRINISDAYVSFGDWKTHLEMSIENEIYILAGAPDSIVVFI